MSQQPSTIYIERKPVGLWFRLRWLLLGAVLSQIAVQGCSESHANDYDDFHDAATFAMHFDGDLRATKGAVTPTMVATPSYDDAGALAFWQGLNTSGVNASNETVASNYEIPTTGDWSIYVRFAAGTQSSAEGSWVRPVIAFGDGVTPGDNLYVGVIRPGFGHSGKLNLHSSGGDIYSAVITDSQPHNALVVKAGSSVKLYVDGALVGSVAYTAPASRKVQIAGDAASPARRLNGRIDDVVIAPGDHSAKAGTLGAGGTRHPGSVGNGGKQLPIQFGPISGKKWNGMFEENGPPTDPWHAEWLPVEIVTDAPTFWHVRISARITDLGSTPLEGGVHARLKYRRNGQWGELLGWHTMPGGDPAGHVVQATFDILKTALEEPFEPGQNWDNLCDIDGDGINNSVDGDVDGDGLPNGQDADDDGDGILDSDDPWPRGKPVCGENDMDGDGIDDCDDGDIDGDTIVNGDDEDDDGDGIPDTEDPTPKGSECEEEGGGQIGRDWWDPPVNVIESRSEVIFPPGDIDDDGIENNDDDDADGDGIPNWSDPDADGDGYPGPEPEEPPTGGWPRLPPTQPPIIIVPPPPPPPPPPHEPPRYEPPLEPSDPCDPCYYLAQIAEMLSYQNEGGYGGSYDPETGEYTPPEDLFPEIYVSPPTEVPELNPEVNLPDMSGGDALAWYAQVPNPTGGSNWQFKVSPDLSQMAGFYPELGSPGTWTALTTFRETFRLVLLCVLIYAYIRKTVNLLMGW